MNEELYSQTREQKGQEFRRAAPNEIHVGLCVWITTRDINVGHTWLEGPYFVTDTIHPDRMSEHFEVFSTHLNIKTAARHGDIWIPIIDTIKPPRGHNV